MFTGGAFDNIDYNPSSTTALGSLHGTGISVFQFPTESDPGTLQEPLVIELNPSSKYSLPESYTNVPAVSCKIDNLTVSEYVLPHENLGVLNDGKADEEKWVRHSLQLLTKEDKLVKESISWAAFHASLAPTPIDPPVLNSLLPLFLRRQPHFPWSNTEWKSCNK